jgi:hypothetical protein
MANMIKDVLLAHLHPSTLVDGVENSHIIEAILGRDPAGD